MRTPGQRGEGRRDLVLAAAENYEWENLRPFVESLHATGFQGDVRFFVSGMSEHSISKLREAGVDVSRPLRIRVKLRSRVFHPFNPRPTRLRWHVQPLYRYLVRTLAWFSRDRRGATARLAGALSNVDVARYFWYFDYLSRTASRYRNVMLTDVRDVVFLGQPFDFDIRDSAHFFLEDEKVTIASQTQNRAWLLGAYGEQVLDEIGDRPIICSGVTIGAVPAVLDYLTVMVDCLARLPRQWKGMDQGVHNYALHKGLVSRPRIVGNREGVVLTLGIMSPTEASAALRERALEVKVVHQYDRHPELAQTISSLTTASIGRREQ